MTFPLAVAPSVKSPGLFLLVNLLAGQSSPGSATKRALLIADKSASGTITADTELVQAVAGEQAVSGLLGPGVLGHLASKALFTEYGLAQLDVVSPAESGGVAGTGTITFATGPPTVAWTVVHYIAGRPIEQTWAAGETDTEAAAALALKINGLVNLPVTATAAIGVVTLLAKTKGPWGNDIRLRVTYTGGTTGTVTASGTTLASGATEFDITNVLLLITQQEYDLILLATSSDDAEDGSASSNPGKLKTHIDALDEGQQALLQQMVVGANDTLAGIKTGMDAMNFGRAQCVFCNNGLSLPAEWAGAEVGARLREESLDPAANRIQVPYKATLYSVEDFSADELTPVEIEDALNNGITPVTYTGQHVPRPDRPITTYHLDAASNPDDRLLDTSGVTGTDAVAKDIRVALPREFEAAKLSPDLDGLGDELPPGVVEVRDVKSFIDGRMRQWIALGVVQFQAYQDALDNGTFIVRVNPSDDTQCDVVLPVSIVPPLAKFSVAVERS